MVIFHKVRLNFTLSYLEVSDVHFVLVVLYVLRNRFPDSDGIHVELGWVEKFPENLVKIKNSEAVVLVKLETSSFLTRNEFLNDCPLILVPSWERARSQTDYKYGL